MKYTVLRLQGDYWVRQKEASAAGAMLYLEQHFNAIGDPTIQHPLGLYIPSQDNRSFALAQEYASTVAEVCPIPGRPRPRSLALGMRGYGNLRHLAGPVGILMEPGFVSHRPFADWARSDAGAASLAGVIVRLVRGACPHGGVIALSVGHAGQTSKPEDKGAPVAGGGWESDLAAEVISRAAAALSRAA